MKRLTILIEVPDDYDIEPLQHRLVEQIEEVKGNQITEADAVPEDLQCPDLVLSYWQEDNAS